MPVLENSMYEYDMSLIDNSCDTSLGQSHRGDKMEVSHSGMIPIK